MVKSAHPYHHGELRRSLIEAATALLLETEGPSLSLRAVARRAGVTHTAAYHHFVDRDALLAAVATKGHESLTRAMHRAEARAGRPPAGFEAMGAAYVRFALQNPALYRLMFGEGTSRRNERPELQRAAQGTFDALVEAIASCQTSGVVRSGSAIDLALTAWSSVHGIASLLLDQQLSFPGLHGRSARALAASVLSGFFIGARGSQAIRLSPSLRR